MYSDSFYEDDIEEILEHHGILGMKWGIRRYQNPDGSLTPEGRKRYGVNTVAEYKAKKKQLRAERKKARKNRQLAKQQAKIDKVKEENEKKLREFRKNPNKYLVDANWIKKNQQLLTNDEIQKAVDRIDKLNKLNNEQRDQMSQVKKYIDTLVTYGKTANSVIDFLNTDAGRMLRKTIGMDPKKRIGYGYNKNDSVQNPNQNQNQNQNQQSQKNKQNDDFPVNVNIFSGGSKPKQSSASEQTSSLMNYDSGLSAKEQQQVSDILSNMMTDVSSYQAKPNSALVQQEYRDIIGYML